MVKSTRSGARKGANDKDPPPLGSYHESTVACFNPFTHECSCSGIGFAKRSNRDAV